MLPRFWTSSRSRESRSAWPRRSWWWRRPRRATRTWPTWWTRATWPASARRPWSSDPSLSSRDEEEKPRSWLLLFIIRLCWTELLHTHLPRLYWIVMYYQISFYKFHILIEYCYFVLCYKWRSKLNYTNLDLCMLYGIPTCCVSIFMRKARWSLWVVRYEAMHCLCAVVPDILIHMQNNVNNIGTECLAEKLAKF